MNPVVPQSPTAGGSGDDDQASFPAQVRQAAWPFGSFSDGSICRALSAIRGCSGSRGVLGVLVLTVILAGLHAAEPAATTPQPQPPMLSGCEFDYPPYCVPKHGKADGFSVELLRAALTAVGQTVSFKVADWDEIKQDLAAGRLQVLPMVSRTPEREALYDFTSPYLTMHGCIVVREDNADIHSTADLKGKQVATAREKYAEEYLRRANLGAVIVPLPSFTTALQELSGGKHDAVVVQKMVALQLMRQAGIHNLKIIGPPIPDFLQAICFAVSKGDNARLALLNEGLAIVMADGTYQQVYAKWFTVSAIAARSRPLIVACDADFPPFTFSQPDTTVDGFAVALWKAVAKEQGLPFELRVRPWGQLMEEFKAGKIDVLICTASSDERRQFARFSVVHSTDHGGIFVRTDDTQIRSEADLVGKSIIVVKGDLAVEHSIAQGWQQQLVLVEQAADGFRLLASGQHDAVLISKIVGSQTLKKEAITTVHALPVKAGADRAFSFAVQRDDVDLLATLNEGLTVCKANGTYDALYDQWLGVYDEQEISLLMVMRHIWHYVVGSLIVFLGLVIGLQYWRLTERKQAEDALRSLAETQTAILNALPAHLALLDPQGVIVAVNDSWRRFGSANALKSTDFFVGRNYLQVCESAAGDCSQEARQVADGLRAVLSGTRSEFFIEYPCHSPNVKRWFRLMATRLHQERLAGVVVMHVDVTDRRLAEEALAESERRFRTIFKTEPECVNVVSPQGRILDMNPAGLAMLEAENLEELTAQSLFSFVAPEFREAFGTLHRQVIGGGSGILEFEAIGLKGTRRWLETHAVPMRDVNNRVTALLGVTRDITARKQAEEKLQLSETELKRAQEMAHVGNWSWDIQSGFVRWSEEMHRIYGVTPETFVNSLDAVTKLTHPEERDLQARHIEKALRSGAFESFEYRVVRPDGGIRIVQVFAADVERDASGNPVRVLGTVQDITERKQIEAEIRQLNAELEQRVLERTAELQAANQELEAFTYSVSHDLRAPLRHLTGFAELLQKNHRAQFDDLARRHLTYISESAVRMGQLIDDLLAFSRSGRTPLRQAPVNLDALVQEVIQGLHLDTQGRRIVWHIAPLPGVNADSNLLRAALTNLFSNALKFTQPRDEATIHMGCTENDCEHVFFIRDNGVGFDMQYVEKLFGVFQRLHATEEFEGTGIGLANVRRIITRHGGRTWAESVLNEGATFYFSLPKPTADKHAERATT